MKNDEITKFSQHNQKVFHESQPARVGQPIVLLEINALHSAHIAYSYFANTMAALYQARLVAYEPVAKTNWLRWLLRRNKPSANEDIYQVYRSFGITKILQIDPCPWRAWRVSILARKLHKSLKTKKAVEQLTLHKIRIGDLLYDSYLKDLKRPTIELDSKEWAKFLKKFLNLFLFWEDYFKQTKVVGINVSHCVYELAIPLRIAVFRNIPAYQFNITHAYRLNKKNLFAYNDFHNFKKQFKRLPKKIKHQGLKLAEKRIARRLQGEIGVDMEYSKKTAYGKFKSYPILKFSKRKKILIATHCFFDSPHSYGDNVFPDFFEWLNFLGNFAKSSNYDWYIKTHPDYLPGTLEVIQGILKKYPQLNLLPPDSSHHQIIKEGINLALTVYGTIGFEYALLGIPVINASQNNPHIAYSFNLHAKSAEHYKKLLVDPHTFHHKASKKEIYEYYFMKNIYNTDNLFFKDYQKTIADLGGNEKQFTPMVYKKWIKEWTPKRHEEITHAIHRFVASGEFKLKAGRDKNLQKNT